MKSSITISASTWDPSSQQSPFLLLLVSAWSRAFCLSFWRRSRSARSCSAALSCSTDGRIAGYQGGRSRTWPAEEPSTCLLAKGEQKHSGKYCSAAYSCGMVGHTIGV